MIQDIDYKNNSSCDKTAEDAFTSEGGYVVQKPEEAEEHADAAFDDQKHLMSEFSIRYNGRCFEYRGYRYEQLADAINYAQLMRSRRVEENHTNPLISYAPVESPSDSDRQLMVELSISFNAGVYEFRGFHYDHLRDAVNYAYICRRNERLRSPR